MFLIQQSHTYAEIKCIVKQVHNKTTYIQNIIHNNTVDIKLSVAVNIYSYRLWRACHLALETEIWYVSVGPTLDHEIASMFASKFTWVCSTAYRSNNQHTVSPAGNRCHFDLLDKNESCPTAVLCHIGCPMVWPIQPVSCWTRLTGHILPTQRRVCITWSCHFSTAISLT